MVAGCQPSLNSSQKLRTPKKATAGKTGCLLVTTNYSFLAPCSVPFALRLLKLQRQRLSRSLRSRKSPVAEFEPFPVLESQNDLIYSVVFDVV